MSRFRLPGSTTEIADKVVVTLSEANVTSADQHAARLRIIEAGTKGRTEIDLVLSTIANEHDIELPFEELGHR
ncbi:MAG: hypothetical protein ABL890_01885 [Candidatus Peribacteraceae bacterium]